MDLDASVVTIERIRERAVECKALLGKNEA